jgi:adenylate cyclase
MSYDADESIPLQVIQDALQRVVASRDFVNSERKRRFLKFVVQETLAGHAGRIKAYSIALDAFDRDPSFNPVADPVVRIEAGRLRRCLEHYYLGEGAADRIRITIPKGGYVPHFIVTDGDGRSVPKALDDADQPNAGQLGELIPAKAAADPARAVAGSSSPPVAPSRLRLLKRPRWLASILSLLLALIIVLWGATLIFQTRILAEGQTAARQAPSLMVPPFANDSGDPALNSFAKSITEEVIGGLIGFQNVLVFGVDSRSRYDTETALRAAAPGVHIGYVLKGRISRAGNQIEITVALLQAADNQFLWSGRFCREFSPNTLIEVPHDIALQVAGVLAQPHGVIDEELRNTAGIRSRSLAHQNVCL